MAQQKQILTGKFSCITSGQTQQGSQIRLAVIDKKASEQADPGQIISQLVVQIISTDTALSKKFDAGEKNATYTITITKN